MNTMKRPGMKRLGLIALVFLFSAGFLSGYGSATAPHHANSAWEILKYDLLQPSKPFDWYIKQEFPPPIQ